VTAFPARRQVTVTLSGVPDALRGSGGPGRSVAATRLPGAAPTPARAVR